MIAERLRILLEYLSQGGFMMIPILLTSILMWTLIVMEGAGLFASDLPDSPRFVPTIGWCAAMAPLLGLLGTVIGMIRLFSALTRFGAGQPSVLATGISEALVTTQAGLIVAIPGMCMAAFLSSRYRKRAMGGR